VVSDFFLELGGNVPPSVDIESVDCRAAGVVLRGGIAGPSDEASGRAISYVENLQANAVFKELFETISLTSIVRDPGTGRMKFEINLKFKPISSPAKKGGKK
jgi:hypothetical protein